MAFPKSRCFPVAYPNGSWPTGEAFNGVRKCQSIGADRKSITLAGLPAGYKVSVGDYIQIRDKDLHMVMESATANSCGVAPSFENPPTSVDGCDCASQRHSGQAVLHHGDRARIRIDDCRMATGRGTVTFRRSKLVKGRYEKHLNRKSCCARGAALVARDFLWFVARDRATGAAVTDGMWSDVGNISRRLFIRIQACRFTRDWFGSGNAGADDDIPLVANLSVQNVNIRLSQVSEHVQTLVRSTTAVRQRVEIFRGLSTLIAGSW